MRYLFHPLFKPYFKQSFEPLAGFPNHFNTIQGNVVPKIDQPNHATATKPGSYMKAKLPKLDPEKLKKVNSKHPNADPPNTAIPQASTGHIDRKHIPVLLNEVMSMLNPKKGGLYIDSTFGLGGHSLSILETPETSVFGVDRDSSILNQALIENAKLREYVEQDRLKLINCRFSKLSEHFSDYKGKIDGILLDVGVSSVHLDLAERGFSYKLVNDAKLDMRMDQNETIITAADIVNKFPEQKLANLIYQYGEEKKSRQIASAIVRARQKKPIISTHQLATVVSSEFHRGSKPYRSPEERLSDACKRTFQALRMYVNDELNELRAALEASIVLLRPGGTLCVITFHSLEDRIVKSFLSSVSGKTSSSVLDSLRSEVEPSLNNTEPILFDIINKKSIKPTQEECMINSRAASAKLRAAIRTTLEPKHPKKKHTK